MATWSSEGIATREELDGEDEEEVEVELLDVADDDDDDDDVDVAVSDGSMLAFFSGSTADSGSEEEESRVPTTAPATIAAMMTSATATIIMTMRRLGLVQDALPPDVSGGLLSRSSG
jgi:hypothetical protein